MVEKCVKLALEALVPEIIQHKLQDAHRFCRLEMFECVQKHEHRQDFLA